ncbi:hypothetical protein [Deinococcus ficus]|uniref:Uncharacterized protein n=1 Tax=Deinococcus ficus TaxID=317577 RepID=A0A221T308_9DEIO|nr:hypothetical protein [Deinococcus ficus]ASN83284.1 hypothetical protein DFI_18980 [Deinococcus ficus]
MTHANLFAQIYLALCAALHSKRPLGLARKLSSERKWQIERALYGLLKNDARFTPWFEKVTTAMSAAEHDYAAKKVMARELTGAYATAQLLSKAFPRMDVIDGESQILGYALVDVREVEVLFKLLGFIGMDELSEKRLVSKQPRAIRRTTLAGITKQPIQAVIGVPVKGADGKTRWHGPITYLSDMRGTVEFHESREDADRTQVYNSERTIVAEYDLRAIRSAFGEENARRDALNRQRTERYQTKVAAATPLPLLPLPTARTVREWQAVMTSSDTPSAARVLIDREFQKRGEMTTFLADETRNDTDPSVTARIEKFEALKASFYARVEKVYRDENDRREEHNRKAARLTLPAAPDLLPHLVFNEPGGLKVDQELAAWEQIANDADTPFAAKMVIQGAIERYTSSRAKFVCYTVKEGRTEADSKSIKLNQFGLYAFDQKKDDEDAPVPEVSGLPSTRHPYGELAAFLQEVSTFTDDVPAEAAD